METDQEHFNLGRSLAVLLVLSLIAPAARAERPLLPGIGAQDRRVEVEGDAAPWRSLVKVQTNLGGRCTGVLVASDRVVTAAHCLVHPRAPRFLPASSLHVLLGYDRGEYRVHAMVAGFATGEEYDPAGRRDPAADWAVLTLTGPVAGEPLPVLAEPPSKGTAAMLGGYSQDRAQILTADRDCRILGAGPGLLVHDCAATRGTSGGALLVRSGAGWAVAGIGVAGGTGAERRNLAVPSAAFIRKIGQDGAAHQP